MSPGDCSDRLNIVDLMADVNRAFDDGDADAWLRSFTADGTLETSSGTRAQGQSELRGFFDGVGHDAAHFTTNSVARISGDRAEHSASYAVLKHVDGAIQVVAIGRYLDSLTRTAAGWRISHRRSEPR
jgi:ketosteroid isomerase-like protein